MPDPLILIVDRDASFRARAAAALSRTSFHILSEETGAGALRRIQEVHVQLVLCEWELTGQNGLDLVRKLRRDPATMPLPVILVTSQTQKETAVVEGLNNGADDILFKPVSPAILLARTAAALRRSQWEAVSETEKLTSGPIRMDLTRHTVKVRKNAVQLTPKEYELLAYFLRHPNRVLSKRQLLFALWGNSAARSTQTVERQIETLRKRLGAAGRKIITLPKLGYRFEAS